jgi:archaeosine-15-forming tRNA-guanine transglycosylase
MNRKIIFLAVLAGIALAAAVPFIVFHARSPVLVVADNSIIQLYGSSRISREVFHSSLDLFRPVKTVAAADDSGDDMVQFAIAEVSSRPYCVLFPLRFAGAARLYREKNPQVRAVLLEGRSPENRETDVFQDIFTYKTDIEADFLRMGAAAAAIDGGKNGKIAVFMETQLQTRGKDAFLRALSDLEEPPAPLFYASYSQFSGISDLSCVVLAGAGAEYLENFSGVPVVFLTWIDPSLIPNDVVLVVDDSPWVQAPQAIRMAAAGLESGLIKSRFLVLNEKKIGAQALRKIKKTG